MKTSKKCCYGCTPETGRSAEPNCHMTCEKYLNWKAEHDDLRDKILSEKYSPIESYKAAGRRKASHLSKVEK